MTDVRASGVRMSVRALARIHAEARAMWNVVIERSASIEELREEPTCARNIHLTVLSNMIEKAEGEAERLGLEICKAMVLATQSEDNKLEAFAYQCFNRFLWRPLSNALSTTSAASHLWKSKSSTSFRRRAVIGNLES